MEMLKTDLDRREGRISVEEIGHNMDSMGVFSFTISIVPKSIKQFCEHFGISFDDVDELVLHQANKFIIQKIAKKLKVDMAKVPVGLKNYGNTTSASIPMAILSECADKYAAGHVKTVASGFGTGLACATVYFETNGIVCPQIMTYTL